jgi:hypothetical protein
MVNWKFNVGDTLRVYRDGEVVTVGVVKTRALMEKTEKRVYEVKSEAAHYVSTSWYAEGDLDYAPEPWQDPQGWTTPASLVMPPEKSWLFAIDEHVRVRAPAPYDNMFRGTGVVLQRHTTKQGDDVYLVSINGEAGWHKAQNLAPTPDVLSGWVAPLNKPMEQINIEGAPAEPSTLSAMLDAAGTPEEEPKYPVRWMTADKRAMRIEDMKNDHLVSTLYFLRRKALSRFKRRRQEHKLLGNTKEWAKMGEEFGNVDWLPNWFRANDPHYSFIEDEVTERGLDVHPAKGWNGKKNTPLEVEEINPFEPAMPAAEAWAHMQGGSVEITDEVHLTKKGKKKGKRKKRLSEIERLQAKQKKRRADDDAEAQPAHNPSRRKFKL